MKYDIAALKRKMLVKYPFFGSVVASVGYKETKIYRPQVQMEKQYIIIRNI